MKEYNLFISHSWSYNNDYLSLNNLLRQNGYFKFNNFSVPIDNPLTIYNNGYYYTELRNKIKSKMKYCNVVLVLAGVYSTYSESIKMEIDVAKELEKPIIAIEPYGSEKTSLIVKENANIIVKWNSNSIISAIKELSNEESVTNRN